MKDLAFSGCTVSYVECFWVFAESSVVRFHKIPSDLILGRSFISFTSTGRLGRGRCCRNNPIFTRYSCWGIAIRRVQALRWDKRLSLAIWVLSSIIAVDGLTFGGHSRCQDELG